MQFIDKPEPWHRSLTVIIFALIALPPIGLILLWLRRDTETGKKLFGTLAALGLSGVYLFLLFGSGIFLARPDPDSESHYAELERQRAEQRQGANAASAAAAPEEKKVDAPAATDPNAAQPFPAVAQPASVVKSTHSYWTDFRGPARDGRYDERPIRTDWPAEGLRPMWKQLIGGGYASFVIADGLAFTIEQRRRQEVAAAYDLETGRELWTQGWQAEFRESMGGDGPRAT